MTQPGTLIDEYAIFRFDVEIDGITHASFTEVSGMEVKTEVQEYKEGGLNGYSHKLPGQTTISNVTLKWGIGHSNALWDWYSRLLTSTDKTPEKRFVSIILYDSMGTARRRWNLTGAFPVKWSGPAFRAGDSSIGIESLELAFGELTVVNSS